jgi:hypothetical protein
MCKYKKYSGTAKGKYRMYKRRGKKKDFDFNLTFEQLHKLITGKCHYCLKLAEPFQGIDRRNNDKGYVMSNCVGCCSECNYAKRMTSEAKFKDYLERITLSQIMKRPALRKKVVALLKKLK